MLCISRQRKEFPSRHYGRKQKMVSRSTLMFCEWCVKKIPQITKNKNLDTTRVKAYDERRVADRAKKSISTTLILMTAKHTKISYELIRIESTKKYFTTLWLFNYSQCIYCRANMYSKTVVKVIIGVQTQTSQGAADFWIVKLDFSISILQEDERKSRI